MRITARYAAHGAKRINPRGSSPLLVVLLRENPAPRAVLPVASAEPLVDKAVAYFPLSILKKSIGEGVFIF
jgi:hypothetical protein